MASQLATLIRNTPAANYPCPVQLSSTSGQVGLILQRQRRLISSRMERQAATKQAKQRGWKRGSGRGGGGGGGGWRSEFRQKLPDENWRNRRGGGVGGARATVHMHFHLSDRPSVSVNVVVAVRAHTYTHTHTHTHSTHTYTDIYTPTPRQPRSYTQSARENGIRFDLNSANRSIDFTAFKHPLAKRQSLGVVPVRVYVYVRGTCAFARG